MENRTKTPALEAFEPSPGGQVFRKPLDRTDSAELAPGTAPAGTHCPRPRAWQPGPACIWLAILLAVLALIRWDLSLMRGQFTLLGKPAGLFQQILFGFRDFSQLVPIVTAMVMVYLADRRRWLILCTLLLAFGLGAAGCYGLKLCLPRYRPSAVLGKAAQTRTVRNEADAALARGAWALRDRSSASTLLATVRWTDTWAFDALQAYESRPMSFPSGHSYGAFAFAAVLAWFYPRLRWVFWTLAAGCAVSRIIDAVHWPSDCLAGAAIGYAGAWAAWKIRPRLFPSLRSELPASAHLPLAGESDLIS